VYLFNFVHPAPIAKDRVFHEPLPPGGYGAHHGCELWYAFDNLALAPWQAGATDQALADAMSSAWVAFARTGNPGVASLPHWPSFAHSREAMQLGADPQAARPFNADALEFFDHCFETLVP